MATLLILSGAPGSGKTTLARALGPRLGLVALEKDAVKEALADAVGPPTDVAASARLGAAAYAALFTLARDLLGADKGVLLESNFRRGRSEPRLVQVAAAATSVRLVHCTAADEIIVQRYASRRRHVAHLDDHRHDTVRADLAARAYEPLRVDWPTLIVRTDTGYDPPLDAITAFVGGSNLTIA